MKLAVDFVENIVNRFLEESPNISENDQNLIKNATTLLDRLRDTEAALKICKDHMIPSAVNYFRKYR